jgi:hypothetical protein
MSRNRFGLRERVEGRIDQGTSVSLTGVVYWWDDSRQAFSDAAECFVGPSPWLVIAGSGLAWASGTSAPSSATRAVPF